MVGWSAPTSSSPAEANEDLSHHHRRKNSLLSPARPLPCQPLAPVGRRRSCTGEKLKITRLRNATRHVDIAGVRFLVDPMLSERHFWPDFGGRVNSEKRNPLVHPAIQVENARNVDAVIRKA